MINWDRCLDALTKLHGCEWCSTSVIECAIRWIEILRKRYPDKPPTLIIDNCDGGLILERTYCDLIESIEILSDKTVEYTRFVDGEVVLMFSLPYLGPL